MVEDELMTLCRFRRGLSDNFYEELVPSEVTTLDQAYTLVQNYETIIKSLLSNLTLDTQVTFSLLIVNHQ